MPCLYQVRKVHTKKKHEVNCARRDAYCFKVTGSWGADDRKRTMEKTVTLCEEHGKMVLGNPNLWKMKGTISHLWWEIEAIEQIPIDLKQEAKKDEKKRDLIGVIKRMFKLKHNQKVTEQEWREAFEDAYKEYIIEEVARS